MADTTTDKLICDECGRIGNPTHIEGVHTYRDSEVDTITDLCRACFHDAVRSGADLY